ncbi:Alpha/Beta hydrolase protein [Mycena rebaudengoi]|nr:Alpha/Beta hydrolase protein [Mycena rebaudengoi]
MPLTTASAAIHITPVVVKTFFQHALKQKDKLKEKRPEEAQDDIFFDQAFHIVKAFIELGTKNTVESLQAFTNTHVPSPFWASVAAVSIPLQTCNDAADLLINWFGPDELKAVVGGERWWQVRGLDGVDGEWITQKEYMSDEKICGPAGRKLSDDDETVLGMEKLDRVMLYVHGGGYFWGSINTHRYQLIRYARKIKGRVFAVNYRKAPQYPWPCPVQDVLAAYLYLIRPPPTALHKPIPPSKIVFAGDSAGGGLCLSVLSVLRDMEVPMPAGAVLISPWVDLTHSFPSVMQNTDTDIIPVHGFLAKPSTLWPVDPLATKNSRVIPSKDNPPPEPGHADQLRPTRSRVREEEEGNDAEGSVGTQKQMQIASGPSSSSSSSSSSLSSTGSRAETAESVDVTWEPRPPKVLMKDPNAVPLELRSQIQLYATTEQLTHPLVSPILQGSLGNLPPLYILAGNDEVLRDEIVYIAHRAAYPEQYPTRKGALRDGHRQKRNAETYTRPTKVHLQVFDDMCHVLTVFTFTHSAKSAYRSIAEFVMRVTDDNAEPVVPKPSPFSSAPSETALLANSDPGEDGPRSEGSEITETTHQQQNAVDNPMRRERVDIEGIVRPMEPPEDIPVLQLNVGEIGIIKEEPTIKWLKGQEEWDQKYKMQAERAIRHRRKNEAKAEKLLAHARDQGLLLTREQGPRLTPVVSSSAHATDGDIQKDRRWGPLDLDDERPPPTAIAKRRDTPEALALLRKHIYHTAPKTHRTIPKLKFADAVKAAFDPDDDPTKAPKQSVSEQQVRSNLIPGLHGLKIWDVLVGYFMRKSSEKATTLKDTVIP